MTRLFKFTERKPNGDAFSFYGQGANRKEAHKEGLANCASTFRPKQDGRAGEPGAINGPTRIAVRRGNGEVIHITLKEWNTK